MGGVATDGRGLCPGRALWEEELCKGGQAVPVEVELLQFHGDPRLDAAIGGQLRELPSDSVTLRRVHVLHCGAQGGAGDSDRSDCRDDRMCE